MFRSLFRAYLKAYQGLPREVWFLSFALFVNRCGTMVLPFLTLYLHEDLGLTEGYAAQLLSVYGLGAMIGTYCGGWLTDKVGAVRLVILFLLLSVPVFLIIPFVKSVAGVSCAIFVLAIFSEGVRPANGTAIAHYTTVEDQTRAFGLQRMALNLGVSFGPAVGGFLAEIDFFWLFLVDAITTLACALVMIWAFGFKKEDLNEPEVLDSAGLRTPPAKKASPLQDGYFMVFLGLILATAVVFFQFHATYPLYLSQHYGLIKRDIGLVFAINTVIIVIFEMLLVDYARRWNLVRTIGWGCLLSCVGFGILPMGDVVWFCILSMMVITIGEMLAMPMASGWVALRSAGKNRGMYMAWYSLIYSIANVIAPLLGGWMYAIDPDMFWYISIGVGVAVLAGFYWLAKRLA